ncbi:MULTISPECIES: salt stress protein, Slr1339 family [unclassified Microcoleus]|uniref:salt stress protein, Slr1339 family n=1 Tax=unclassified Microcoleus TaxID=2642155 RepID=UPI002FD55A92
MESIERLLGELKAEYQASQKIAELKSQALVPAQAPSNATFKTSDINLYASPLDKDLAQIKAEYESQNKAQEVASLEPLKAEHELQNKAQAVAALEPLKAEHEAQNKAQEVVSLQPQPAEKVAGPQLDVQTHRQKVRQAQVWLKKLDKNSDEGYWFDQFAFKYSSRIDAAIDYLQAVNEFD